MNLSFFAMPKCASMSMRSYCEFNNIDVLWHSRHLKLRQQTIANAGNIFFVWRDPIDRIVSAYYYLKSGGLHHLDKDDWLIFCSQYRDLHDFIDSGGLEKAAQYQMHFLPQYLWFTEMKSGNTLFALDFANLNQELETFSKENGLTNLVIPHYNRNSEDPLPLEDRHIQKISTIYYEDYRLRP